MADTIGTTGTNNSTTGTIKMVNLMGVQTPADNSEILGKFLYFSLANVLIDRDTLNDLCAGMNLPVTLGNRLATVDAFKSATGDIYERNVVKDSYSGELRISKVYCRDNQKQNSVYSRELVKETLGESTNRYIKLANLQFDKDADCFDYTVDSYDGDVDVRSHCDRAVELFEVYKQCVGRSQIECLTDNLLRRMDALKLSVHGRLFFVPKTHMDMVDIFEDFITALNTHNRRDGELAVNSIYVISDDKQREKMTAEFYNATKKEIETYTASLEHLIATGSQSAAIMERWGRKIDALETKKRHYEELLKRELTELDEQYDMLRFLAQELAARVSKIQVNRAA